MTAAPEFISLSLSGLFLIQEVVQQGSPVLNPFPLVGRVVVVLAADDPIPVIGKDNLRTVQREGLGFAFAIN